MFTSTIKAVVTWEHDPTAHYVSFKAAWSKRVPNPAALEQLSIIYKQQQITFMSHILRKYNQDKAAMTQHNICHC